MLADGTLKTYWYAWKGGPRLPGKPGDPKFMDAYNEAVSRKHQPPAGVMLSILSAYQQSDDFRQLAERTRFDYVRQIKKIEAEFIDFPLSALADRRSRAVFMEWRDQLAANSRRQADYAWSVLARILSWAHDRGLVVANPCTRGGRLYRGSRAENVWTAYDEAQFMQHAPAHPRLAFMLALWTGQRQGDLLSLVWSAYDGGKIRLRQNKTGARVVIPVGAPLKALLDSAPRRSPVMLVTLEGKPWTPDGFRVSWRKACTKAGIVGLTFNDLRGTAVTRLALAGCTEAEIATLTGHSLRDVRSILDAHYLARDPALAESAIRKLETRTKIPD
ncbi:MULTISPECIES: tyrosine-type recombinase/integrase [unclassified Xanthobacter]|uniref:tyrosine-type recombinase/integrase n=1 Tax=unclassified Xanthobacter TaxID=2623496 RepID=UPI001EDEE1B1